MALEIKHIDTPDEWQSSNDWDSHLPLLYLALSKGNFTHVTEFGCGNGSTPHLWDYCHNHDIQFTSFETNDEWTKVGGYIIRTDDYLNIIPSVDRLNNLLFIDCAPGEIRKELLKKHANHAKALIAHDSEPGANYVYGMDEILSTFQYRLDYKPEGNPHTTIVSNFINPAEWL